MELHNLHIMGADHQAAAKNGADFSLTWQYKEYTFLAISDGVGQYANSDYGSRWLLTTIRRLILDHNITNFNPRQFIERVNECIPSLYRTERLWDYNHPNADEMYDFYAATLMMAVIGPDLTYILGAGDGFYGVNDEWAELEGGDLKIPLRGAFDDGHYLRLHRTLPTHYVTNIFVASDGLRYWVKPEQQLDPFVLPFSNSQVPMFEGCLQDWRALELTVHQMNQYSPKRPRLLRDDFSIAYANLK